MATTDPLRTVSARMGGLKAAINDLKAELKEERLLMREIMTQKYEIAAKVAHENKIRALETTLKQERAERLDAQAKVAKLAAVLR